jgi:thiamine biosynthesis lipoprotein
MGTLFSVKLYASDRETGSKVAQAAFHRVAELDRMMSDYRDDSELMRLCAQPSGRPVQVSQDLFDVLERAQQISEITGGAFDITVGPLVRLWRETRTTKILPSSEAMASARASVGWRMVRLDKKHHSVTLLLPNMRLDLGGIAKGFAAEKALKTLGRMGVRRALVAAGGDIAIGDAPADKSGWTVGLTDIDEHSNKTGHTLLLHNAAVSTSGDTEQAVEIQGIRYSHILNPATGMGLTNRIQVSVIAPDATTTDALATALCVLGVERSLKLADSLPRVSALVLIKADGKLQSFASSRYSRLPTTPTKSN